MRLMSDASNVGLVGLRVVHPCQKCDSTGSLAKNGQGYVKQKRLFERQEIPPRKDENMTENDTVGISSCENSRAIRGKNVNVQSFLHHKLTGFRVDPKIETP